MVIATLSDNPSITMQLGKWLKQYCELYNTFPTILDFNTKDEVLNTDSRLDVIFISLRGPEGFNQAGQIKNEKRESKVIFISDTTDYAVKCMRMHFTDYIVEPVEFKHFVRAMKLSGVG